MNAAEVAAALREHTNVLLYGPPGTGKTRLMLDAKREFLLAELAGASDTDVVVIDTEDEHTPLSVDRLDAAPTLREAWVTFHQSYAYEDFVIGLRPSPDGKSLLGLKAAPGVLLQLAAFAMGDGCSSLLLIDEINRGNASRVFGEFITLLEPDKRLAMDGTRTETTVEVVLPYLQPADDLEIDVGTASDPRIVKLTRRFSMPRRVYTLASMNSVDKSVAPLDAALRRRFYIVDLIPDRAAVAEVLGVEVDAGGGFAAMTTPDHVRALAGALLMELNEGIGMYLGPEFELGQWYLRDLRDDSLTLEEAKHTLVELWEHVLSPQLEELFIGQVEQLVELLLLSSAPSPSPVEVIEPEPQRQQLGGRPYLQFVTLDEQFTLAFLAHIVGVELSLTAAGPEPENA